MKGILVFNSLGDLLFLKTDEELHKHLSEYDIKNRQPGVKEELPLTDVVIQLFSPLITSHKIMQSQFSNPYTSVECENGIQVAFTEHLGFYLFAIGGILFESVSLLQRRLGVFLVLTKMLYGPALHLMNDNTGYNEEDRARTKLLSQMIDMWDLLRIQESSFLVEAVERLLVNHSIRATSVNLLKTVLEKVRVSCRSQESCFCHAFLLVESKLLALYSSRNASQLLKPDLLLLILITAVLQSPEETKVGAEGKEDSRTLGEGRRKDFQADSSDSDEFFIPKPTSSARTSVAGRRTCGRSETIVGKGDQNKNEQYFQTPVFLESSLGVIVPYVIYTVPIHKNVVLVIVREVTSKGGVASGISAILDILYSVQLQTGEVRNQHTIDCLETNFKRVCDSSKKLRLLPTQEQYVKNMIIKWERLKSVGLFYFLKNTQKRQMGSKLDAAVIAMCESLKDTFAKVLLPAEQDQESAPSADLTSVFHMVQCMVRKRLLDCTGTNYLLVKANCNLTMPSYLHAYPGLVHFIYVDRSKNCVLAPSMFVPEEEEQNTISDLDEKIRNMVYFVNRYLQSRHFSMSWREEDFCYSYFLWFEDPSGKAIKPKTFPDLKDFPLPGTLSGDFYSKLVKECFPSSSLDHINCFEIYCIHESATPSSTVLEQIQRLTTSLWEASGAAHNPLDLL